MAFEVATCFLPTVYPFFPPPQSTPQTGRSMPLRPPLAGPRPRAREPTEFAWPRGARRPPSASLGPALEPTGGGDPSSERTWLLSKLPRLVEGDPERAVFEAMTAKADSHAETGLLGRSLTATGSPPNWRTGRKVRGKFLLEQKTAVTYSWLRNKTQKSIFYKHAVFLLAVLLGTKVYSV